jgi:DNA/RNA-binding domain of Phe-tRNA-synthetase-like protein
MKVGGTDSRLEELVTEEIEEIKRKYSPSDLEEIPRLLLKQTLGKDESSVEALIRRVLKGRAFPSINNVVDACNLAVLKTLIAMGVFDADRISGDAAIRFARKGETFIEIGGREPMELRGGEMVISDSDKIFSIPIYRDGEETKITEQTRNIMLVAVGTKDENLAGAANLAVEYITRHCGEEGEIE